MLSIIICSKKGKIPEMLDTNICSTVGVPYELVVIDNSENKYSIFSAYNEGFRRSVFPYLCFLHEDTFFCTDSWGKNIIQHLENPETGIVGVAGGGYILRLPAPWSIVSRSINIIQSGSEGKNTRHISKPDDYGLTERHAILLDGVFLCMRRELFEHISFDETLKGFHGYDFDISLQATHAGYRNYVIYDVLLQHFSEGNRTQEYYRNIIAVFKKWNTMLPVFADSIPEAQKAALPAIEWKNMKRLVKKMAATGFRMSEISQISSYYLPLFKGKRMQKLYFYILIGLLKRIFI